MPAFITCGRIDSQAEQELKLNFGEYEIDDCLQYDGIYWNSDDNRIIEKFTNLPIGSTPKEFLRFLDSDFKPEINLSDSNQDLFTTKFAATSKSSEIKAEDVNLAYRGQKNMFKKGKNAERKDVTYKTFIRAVRRYLWTLFEKEFDVSKFKDRKTSEIFRQYVTRFYEKYFKQHLSTEIETNEEFDNEICVIISSMMTNKHSFPYKTDKHKKFINLFEEIYKRFCKFSYEKFFNLPKVVLVFKMLNESGVFSEMINAYPKLSESKEAYINVVKSIIEFRETKILI